MSAIKGVDCITTIRKHAVAGKPFDFRKTRFHDSAHQSWPSQQMKIMAAIKGETMWRRSATTGTKGHGL